MLHGDEGADGTSAGCCETETALQGGAELEAREERDGAAQVEHDTHGDEDGEYELEDLALQRVSLDLAGRPDDDSASEEEEDGGVGHGLEPESDTSDFKTYVNFIKSYVGSGILATNYCIRLLLVCAAKYEHVTKKKASYASIGSFALGKSGSCFTISVVFSLARRWFFVSAAVNASLVFSQVGFCCVYVLFIGHNLESWAWSMIAAPALILVCWLRSLSWLAVISFVGQTAMTMGLGAILVFAFVSMATSHPEVQAMNLTGFPIFFGVAVYTFEGIGLVLPMRRAMTKPNHYPFILDSGYLCVVLMVISFGTIGYLGYGESVSDEVTLSLPSGIIADFVKALLILAIFSTYPVQLFPIITLAEKAVLSRVWSSPHIFWFRNAVRTGLVICTVVFALSIPRFSLFVSLVGAIGGSMLAFILPSLFHLVLFKDSAPYPVMLISGCLLVFGALSSVASISVTLFQIYQVFTGEIE